jgi:hypothetical protein
VNSLSDIRDVKVREALETLGECSDGFGSEADAAYGVVLDALVAWQPPDRIAQMRDLLSEMFEENGVSEDSLEELIQGRSKSKNAPWLLSAIGEYLAHDTEGSWVEVEEAFRFWKKDQATQRQSEEKK